MIKKFLIVAPPFTSKSAGIVCLHELCDALVKIGYESYVLIYDIKTNTASYRDHPNFFSPALLRSKPPESNTKDHLLRILAEGITIYPEIVVGNPLNAKNVVRYFLNYDGILTNRKSNYSENDFCLAFHKKFFDKAHGTLFKPISHQGFTNSEAPPFKDRQLDLTYIGKGNTYQQCFRINNTLEITRTYPATKEELAIVLKNTRYLFSWDNISGIVIDAILCGARPVLFHDYPVKRDDFFNDNFELGKVPYLSGKLYGDKVLIEERDDFEELRSNLISKIESSSKNWIRDVIETTKIIFNHFL